MDRSDELGLLKTQRGFSEAVIKLEGLMYSVASSVLYDRELCADAVQSALLKAWSRIDSLKDPDRFKSWLARIVLNESLSMKRKDSPLPLPEDMALPEADRETRIDVMRAVRTLDEKHRIPVVLYYFEDMPVPEIASVLKLPKGTVMSRLSRARDALRKELKDYEF